MFIVCSYQCGYRRDLKCIQTNGTGNKDRLKGLAGAHTEGHIRLISDIVRVLLADLLKDNVQGRLGGRIVLIYVGCTEQLHYRCKAPVFLRSMVTQVEENSCQQGCFGFLPEGISFIGSGRCRILYKTVDKDQYILFFSDIFKGIIAERCTHVRKVEHHDLIAVALQERTT